MKNNFRKIIIFTTLFIVFCTAIVFMIDRDQNDDYARITDVEYKGILTDDAHGNAKLIVKERLTFDIHAASYDNLYWELWRDLVEMDVDGVEVRYKVNSVKQILPDGREIIYKESGKLYWDDSDYEGYYGMYGPGKWYHSPGPYNEDWEQYECVFFYIDGVYREEMVFEIEYEMSNAALRYNDASELYISMYSEESINYLDSFKGQILIADKDMPNTGNYEAHTYGTINNSFEFQESDTMNPGYHTFFFDLDKDDLKFKPFNEYLEFTLVSFGDDKHKFTDYAPLNDYYYDDVLDEIRAEQEWYDNLPKFYRSTKLLLLVGCIGVSIIIAICTRTTDKRIRKKYIFCTTNNDVSTYKYVPSNLDPTFAAALVFCKDKKTNKLEDSYSAILLSLVRKGYIELDKINVQNDWAPNNVKIVIKYNKLQNNDPTLIPPGQLSITEQTNNNNLPYQPHFAASPIMQPVYTLRPTIFEERNQSSISSEEIYGNTNSTYESLTLTEEYYFKLLMRHSRGLDISMSSFQNAILDDYDYTNEFVRQMDDSIAKIGTFQGYFQKLNYDEPKKRLQIIRFLYIIVGIIAITIVNLYLRNTGIEFAYGAFFILGITLLCCANYINKISHKYILLTRFGEEEYIKWRGLYNYLNSDTVINDSSVVDLATWEQYLIYATAFGIADKVNAALNIKCPIVEKSQILNNRYYRSRHFRHTNRSFRSSVRTISHYAASGGHGGYGGGGRGGGGGGGGH